jgi:hypothetical protein
VPTLDDVQADDRDREERDRDEGELREATNGHVEHGDLLMTMAIRGR